MSQLGGRIGNRIRRKQKTKLEKLKKPGKTYTKAQLLALKRIAEDKTISQVKSENKESMKKKAAARHADFKAARKLKIGERKKEEEKRRRKRRVPNLKFLK